MQDRFKFRVVYYNDVEKKYFIFEPDLISADGTARAYAHGESGADEYYDTLTLNQCTGLKDKNGKLIYENDIVKFYFDNDEIIAILIWDNDESRFYLNTTDYFKDKYVTDYEITKQEKYEVIGNIYENPELLEVENDNTRNI